MTKPMQDIAGLRVLELTDASTDSPVAKAVSICGKLLAGQGADVLRLEPKAQSRLDAEQTWLHTGKSSFVLTLDESDSAAQIEQLIAGTDVLLDGLGIDRLASLGLAASRLRRDYPQLVIVQVTPFGQHGPYRDYAAEEITLYAMSGLMYSTGDPDRAPLNSGPAICAYSAGFKAQAAAMLALYRRQRDGGGDVIDLSIAETAMDNLEIAITEKLNLGKTARRNGDEHAIVPWRTYACKDGEAAIIGGPMRHWLDGARLFESDALLQPDLHSVVDRIKRRSEVAGHMAPWLARNTRLDIYHAGQAAGLAWSYVASVPEALESPQNTARGYFVENDQPGFGVCRMPGAPFRSTAQPWETQAAPLAQARVPDAHWSERDQSGVAEPNPEAPLAGIRVLDFSHDWAGPHAARMLADYGAEVIKVEYPGRLDGMRGGYSDKFDEHPRFWQLHRGKRSVTLDLKVPEHLQCCLTLACEADVVIENCRPGVMQKLGVGYQALAQQNPGIIMASLSAFGADGPESRYAGYGGGIEAISGIQSLTAYARSSASRRIREMDVFNGVAGVCAVLSALVHRQATGEGQWIDLSERETCTWLIGEHITEFTADGRQTLPLGNRDASHAPQGVYPCTGEDRWVAITVKDDAQWQRLAAEMGRPDLGEDERLKTAQGRYQRHQELDDAISEWTRECENIQIQQRLQAAGIACGRVADVSDLVADPHLLARDWFAQLEDAKLPGLPFTFARGQGKLAKRGPSLGQDNHTLLADAGLSQTAWPDLRSEKLGTAFDNDPGLAAALSSQ